ncbi:MULTISPECIES: hypothetical protein [unclassified Paenibacillus]|uniref:hypothetical protein n=1 Tax=unclassified Paenibacillus TaxID=185978 RepID=UPI00030E291F|nr:MULTISPECIES: hypothetical protein [unclassified Paenibacillus]MCM3339086.1 carboxypeptidase [Paenibacillus sp. MER TA 81-3]
MIEIKATKFRRPVEIDGRLCAEVGIIPADDKEIPLLAYIAPVRNGGYELVRVVHNDASLANDWYDNNMHNAFEEVAAETFVTSDYGVNFNAKSHFLDAVLGSTEVRYAVDDLFQMD